MPLLDHVRSKNSVETFPGEIYKQMNHVIFI